MPKQTKKSTKKTIKNRRSPDRGRSRVERFKFLPALLIAGFATFLTLQPHSLLPQSRGVLAYATDVNQTGLLENTNNQRLNNGSAALKLNGLLTSAAQAKANDMVARGYWSHNTPDGQEPWVFFAQAGYQYAAAGENLAYGFITSNDTVIGWMNSPAHKENLLNGTFTEVGFGIANTPNYCYTGNHDVNPSTPDTLQCYGNQTIMVAMYGKPLYTALPLQTTPVASTAPAATPPQQTLSNDQPSPKEPEIIADLNVDNAPSTAANPTTEPLLTANSTTVRRINILSGGNPLLSVGFLTISVMVVGLLWAAHKGFHIRRYIVAGENFILHHAYIDLTVLAIIYLAFVLLSTVGAVR